ncbi:succinate dehydrogenase / fumarate reductase cytochrome b subunit [Haloferula luteola]|uniref:Succinate dehydrogenase / fumarate reductase cytochrome b subunit n=1 Tax=Haloferula luteola TaxID=595692 RepID=A0A840V2L5_9BACT|nr:succinate dehydrogenase cytochrome b subunit [Haloferula luteola]MBB5352232.1 succinate dehydrogenase / fumarate reductase cytochrome b subunit [Haloferula luteola]
MSSQASCFPIVGRIWSSTIGRKLLVALTGAVLTLFLAGHLAGNLLVFVGREAFNDYAEFLHHMIHGAGVWIARAVLLTCLVIHVAATISLTRQNKAARQAYENKATIQASKSSLVMIWSGLTILAFIIFHLLHFTVRVSYPAADFQDPLNPERFDAWGMVIKGFTHPLTVLFYVIAMGLLCSHISHGVQSMFQTLGLRSKKSAPLLRALSIGYAVVIFFGFISIPISILVFGYGR